ADLACGYLDELDPSTILGHESLPPQPVWLFYPAWWRGRVSIALRACWNCRGSHELACLRARRSRPMGGFFGFCGAVALEGPCVRRQSRGRPWPARRRERRT